jgi:hypothetical protein
MPTCAELEVPDIHPQHRSLYMATPINSQPVQADSQPIMPETPEMPCGTMPYKTAELSQYQTLPPSNNRNFPQLQCVPAHERQWSGISAISTDSSARCTSMSSFAATRQNSEMSSDLDYTPATSISLGHGSGVPNSSGTQASSIKRPELSVDTHLMPPYPSFADAITDSPSEMDDDAQESQQPAVQRTILNRLKSTEPEVLSDSYNAVLSAEYNAPVYNDGGPSYDSRAITFQEGYEAKHADKSKQRALLSPFTSPPPPSYSFLPGSHVRSMNNDHRHVTIGNVIGTTILSPGMKSDDRRGERMPALLNAFESFANAHLYGHSKSSLAVCLQDCFDLLLSHFGRESTRLHRFCSTWGMTPSIDRALCAFTSIMSDGQVPRPDQLLSLAFFSLSLICLSLDGDSLEGALSALHLNTKAWAGSLEYAYRRDFEQLVDDLWLPSGRSPMHKHLQDHILSLSVDLDTTQLLRWWADDFILQIAERFIACKHTQPPPPTHANQASSVLAQRHDVWNTATSIHRMYPN